MNESSSVVSGPQWTSPESLCVRCGNPLTDVYPPSKLCLQCHRQVNPIQASSRPPDGRTVHKRVSKQRFRHPKAKLGPPPALQCIICAKPASPHISAYYGVSACISCYDRLGAARFQPVPEVVEPTVVPRKHPEARTRAKSSIVAPHTSGPPPPPPSHVPFLQPTVPHIVTDRSPSSSKLVVPSSWLNSPLHDLISRLETANHFNQNGEFIFPHFLPASPGATLEAVWPNLFHQPIVLPVVPGFPREPVSHNPSQPSERWKSGSHHAADLAAQRPPSNNGSDVRKGHTEDVRIRDVQGTQDSPIDLIGIVDNCIQNANIRAIRSTPATEGSSLSGTPTETKPNGSGPSSVTIVPLDLPASSDPVLPLLPTPSSSRHVSPAVEKYGEAEARTPSLTSAASASTSALDSLADDELTAEDNGHRLRGWDSELSELESDESGGDDKTEDDDETEDETPVEQSSGLRITLPAVVRKAVSKPLHICKKAWCHNMLAPRSRWKTCVFCRRTSRMYERAKRGGYYKWLKNDEDDDILDQTGEVVVLTGGRRKCTIRTCTEILPPAEEYRWKMCEGCRTRTRLRARERKHDAPAKPGSTSTTSDEDADLPLSKQLELKRQIQRLKGLTLTFRGRTIAKVDTRPPESPSLPTHVATPVEAAKGWAQSMLVHDNVVRMTVYQTFEGLIEDFYTRLASFVTAQSLYILSKRMRQPGSDVGSPAVFTFDGEYSVVADPAGGDVSARIHAVQVTISQHLGLEFRHIGTRVDPSGMIDGAFSCTHEVLIPLPEEPTAPTEVPLEATEGKSIPQPQALLRRMAGELNISLSWDRSHLYFPGMRTAVRFCLVG